MKQQPPPPNARYRHRQTLADTPVKIAVLQGQVLLPIDGLTGFARPRDDKGEWYDFTLAGFFLYDEGYTFRVRRCNVDWL